MLACVPISHRRLASEPCTLLRNYGFWQVYIKRIALTAKYEPTTSLKQCALKILAFVQRSLTREDTKHRPPPFNVGNNVRVSEAWCWCGRQACERRPPSASTPAAWASLPARSAAFSLPRAQGKMLKCSAPHSYARTTASCMPGHQASTPRCQHPWSPWRWQNHAEKGRTYRRQ